MFGVVALVSLQAVAIPASANTAAVQLATRVNFDVTRYPQPAQEVNGSVIVSALAMIEDMKKTGAPLKDTDRIVFTKHDGHVVESVSDSGVVPSGSRTLAYAEPTWAQSQSVQNSVAITVKYVQLVGSVARFFQEQSHLPRGVTDRDLAHYDVLIFPKGDQFFVALVHHRSGIVTSAGCFDGSAYDGQYLVNPQTLHVTVHPQPC